MKLSEKIGISEFDIIEIPSRGYFYNFGRSYIYTKLLTAKEENILTSPFISEYGDALDLALESVILDDISVDNLLSVDRKAIIMFLRSKAVSDTFELEITCNKCSTNFTQEFRLSNFEMSDTFQKPTDDGLFTFSFKFNSTSEKEYVVKLFPLTHGAEKAIKKFHADKVSTFEVIYQIHSINENDDRDFIERFIQKMPLKKFQELKNKIDKSVPKIYEELETNCVSCYNSEKMAFKIDDGLLKFDPNYRLNYEEEIFLLEYYGKGGFQREEIFNMSIAQRKANLDKINREIDKRNKMEKEASKKSQSKR